MWEHIEFGKIADFKNGINFEKEQKGVNGIPTIDVKNMYSDSCYVNTSDLYRVNKIIDSDYYLTKGDLLFVRSSMKEEGVGWTCLFNGESNLVTFCGFIIRARIKDESKEEIDPKYLTYFFRSEIPRKELVSGSGRVAITNINQGLLKSIKIPKPPLSEQRKIAHVLSTVQNAIEQQDNLIRTTTELKKALMQKLFTEGTRGEPQKETEIGLVPESWGVVKIEKLIINTKIKDPGKEPEKEFIYVDVSSVSNEFFRIENTLKILGKEAPSRARKLIQDGDVIFATVRPTLKRIAKISQDYHNQICSTGYCVIKPDPDKLIQEYLYQYLQTDFFIEKIEKLQRGASYPAVRDTDVKGMYIPLPKLSEQKEIGRTLNILDQRNNILISKKQTLTALFKTLLHDLMTGQRRVHELEFEALESQTSL